jgi:hypothetical protein
MSIVRLQAADSRGFGLILFGGCYGCWRREIVTRLRPCLVGYWVMLVCGMVTYYNFVCVVLVGWP